MKAALAGLAALAVAMGIGRFAFTPLLPMMQADGLVTLKAGGWLASANYAGYLAGALWAAVQPVRSQIAIRIGLSGIAVTTLAMAATPGLAAALVLRALAGIFSAWVLVHVSAWSFERFAGARRPALAGVLFAGVGLGIVAAGLVCLVLMAADASSAAAWGALGALAFALGIAVWGSFPASASWRASSPRPTTRWNREWTRVVICYGAYGFGYIIPATYLPAMARDAVADPELFGWVWPLFGAAAAVSTLASASLLGAVKARRMWIAAHVVMAGGVAAPLVLGGMAGPLVAAACVGGTFVAVTMLALHDAREVAGEGAPRLMAALTAAFALGQIAGPAAVTAWLGMGGTLNGALGAASAALLASAAVLVPARRG